MNSIAGITLSKVIEIPVFHNLKTKPEILNNPETLLKAGYQKPGINYKFQP